MELTHADKKLQIYHWQKRLVPTATAGFRFQYLGKDSSGVQRAINFEWLSLEGRTTQGADLTISLIHVSCKFRLEKFTMSEDILQAKLLFWDREVTQGHFGSGNVIGAFLEAAQMQVMCTIVMYDHTNYTSLLMQGMEN